MTQDAASKVLHFVSFCNEFPGPGRWPRQQSACSASLRTPVLSPEFTYNKQGAGCAYSTDLAVVSHLSKSVLFVSL